MKTEQRLKRLIKLYIHTYPNSDEIGVYSFNMEEISSYVLVGTQEVLIDVPYFDPIQNEIESLDKQAEMLRLEYESQKKLIADKLERLLKKSEGSN